MSDVLPSPGQNPADLDLVTAAVTILSNLSAGSGIEFRCGYDTDTDSRNMQFSWILGGEDHAVIDGNEKQIGERAYLCQFDDTDGMRRFLKCCLDSLDTLEDQMRRYRP